MTQQQSSLLSLGVCVLLVSVIFVPAILLFSFLLLPTILLFYYDSSDIERTRAKAVGSLNVVGTAHAVSHSLQNYGSLDSISELLRDPLNWLYPIGLAGLGMLVYRSLPGVIRIWTEFWINRKESLLKERQIKLVEDWGQKVRGTLGVVRDYPKYNNEE